ncbi:MAG: hypothetical protein L0G99_02545 [Propionibacteriales bacterium]|nr:hypothetical protein [Propionibacteriales bacterium]
MKLPRGKRMVLGGPPPSDQNNVQGSGWTASRTADGYVLTWIGGEMVSREMGGPITEADFKHLRQHPNDFIAVVNRLQNDGLVRVWDQ